MYEGEIKNMISMEQFCDRYGIRIERGFVLCPFHDDGSPSCKIYPGNRGFHCFSCGSGGDVIDFAQQYFSLSKNDAVKKLNADFCLNLPLNEYDRDRAEKQLRQRRIKQQRQKDKEQELTERYWDLYDILMGMETVIAAFRPVAIDIQPSQLFLKALRERDHIEAELAFAEHDLRMQKDRKL